MEYAGEDMPQKLFMKYARCCRCGCFPFAEAVAPNVSSSIAITVASDKSNDECIASSYDEACEGTDYSMDVLFDARGAHPFINYYDRKATLELCTLLCSAFENIWATVPVMVRFKFLRKIMNENFCIGAIKMTPWRLRPSTDQEAVALSVLRNEQIDIWNFDTSLFLTKLEQKLKKRTIRIRRCVFRCMRRNLVTSRSFVLSTKHLLGESHNWPFFERTVFMTITFSSRQVPTEAHQYDESTNPRRFWNVSGYDICTLGRASTCHGTSIRWESYVTELLKTLFVMKAKS